MDALLTLAALVIGYITDAAHSLDQWSKKPVTNGDILFLFFMASIITINLFNSKFMALAEGIDRIQNTLDRRDPENW